jgi:hypothetical protein
VNFCSRASQLSGAAVAGTGVFGQSYVFLPVPKQAWGRSEMNAAWASPEELSLLKRTRRSGVVTRLYHPRDPSDALLVYRGSCGSTEALGHLLAGFSERWRIDEQQAPRLAVCTQGTRDRCCAKWGFAVYRQARALFDAGRSAFEPLECSHLGGDRFAATGVFLPSGSMYAHLDHTDLEAVATAEAAGAIAAGDHYRGRVFDDELIQIVRAGLARDGVAADATARIAILDPEHPEAGRVRVRLSDSRTFDVGLGAEEARFYASCSAMDAGKLARARRVVYAGATPVAP